jgi:hypothetical protein
MRRLWLHQCQGSLPLVMVISWLAMILLGAIEACTQSVSPTFVDDDVTLGSLKIDGGLNQVRRRFEQAL